MVNHLHYANSSVMVKRFRYSKTLLYGGSGLPLWQNASVIVKLFSMVDLCFRYGKTLPL